MRHRKHSNQLGVKKAHRLALMANLAVALIKHGKIKTTLAKAKALRPFIEKIITLAKNAAQTDNVAEKLHYRRQAIAQVRDVKAVAKLFDEAVQEFLSRPGGYTRIYKLLQRRGDAAEMAQIEMIAADDEGYKKQRRKKKAAKPAGRAKAAAKAPVAEEVKEEAPAEESEKKGEE